MYMSRFGTGWIASGKPPRARSGRSIRHVGVCVIKTADPEATDRLEPQEEDTAICALSTVSQRWTAPPLHVEGGIFQPYDFLTTESLGTDLPRRCTSCHKCKECKFRTDCLTFKEDEEYRIILEGLKFDKERGRWRATYPFHIPPTTLKDNYGQVFKYTLAQEKRLAKQGRTEEFNAEFYKTVERGVFKEITKEEMAAWDCPVNYISMVEAFKEGPHSTTPLRICMNSSLKQPYPVSLSLNDCLIKGPSALVDLFTVTLCIREHSYVLTKDLSKFYQRVDADPIAQNLRRVMWRGGNTSAEMKVYITTTVNFGDKPAGCIAIAAARETAAMDEGEFREAAWFLQNRTYVDDATAGAHSMDRLEALSGEMEAVAKRGGFEFKETLMSGDKEDESGEPHKVLGLIWETEADRLRVDVKLNLGAKKAGLHLMENIELGKEPEKALPEVITKRELWRVAQGQYDPLGLLCDFTIRFKILMRSIVGETSQKVTGWDDDLPTGTNEEFPKVVSHLGELRAITFPKPKEEVVGKPMLLIFGDGSTSASCALAYLRWQMADGTVQCRLLAGKTRVAPKCKISIPRMELMGALLAVRLARKIQDSLQMELEAVRYFTDSAFVLGMILRESATYQEFVDTRVSEIRTKSDPETEWFWIPGEMNVADMGTRPTVVPKDMGPGTPYQEGLQWMKGPPETWPAKRNARRTCWPWSRPQGCGPDCGTRRPQTREPSWSACMGTCTRSLRGEETRQPHAHNEAGGQRDRDEPQPAGRAVQGSGQVVPAAGRTGLHWQRRIGRIGGRNSDLQRGRIRR